MSDQIRDEHTTPRFHIAIIEDGADNSARARLMLTPQGSAQEALADLVRYASPTADPALVSQHIAAILHSSSGIHLVGSWPPNVPAGAAPSSSDEYCSKCGQKVA